MYVKVLPLLCLDKYRTIKYIMIQYKSEIYDLSQY